MRKLLLFVALFAASAPLFAEQEYQPIDVRSLRNKVSVRMNETVRFTFDQRGDHLVNPRVVNAAQKRATLTLKLIRSPRGLSDLFITSTFPKTLRFRCAAHFAGRPGFLTTKTHPVYPKIMDAEGFFASVEEFVLFDFHVTDERVR